MDRENAFIVEPHGTFNLRGEQCFCHFNGYKVKDADARRMLSGEVGMGHIKVSSIEGKNKFDSERWYNELHDIAPSIMTKVIVDDKEYYKFRGAELYSYEYMWGEFKENTQYTISCKARQYTQSSDAGTGFAFNYTDGTRREYYIANTTEEYDFVVVSEENKTIKSICVSFYTAAYGLVRDIQIEEGTIATEYAPYFELNGSGTTTEGNSNPGYYYTEIPLPLIIEGEDILYKNEITDITCKYALRDLIEQITKDGVLKPTVVIANATEHLDTDVGSVDLPSPREIILNDMSHSIGSDDVHIYGFTGFGDFHGSESGKAINDDAINLSGRTNISEFRLHLTGTWDNGKFDVINATLHTAQYHLVSEKYIDKTIIPTLVHKFTLNAVSGTQAKITPGSIETSEVIEFIQRCYDKGINKFNIKMYFSNVNATNYNGRYVDLLFGIENNSLVCLNPYSICWYDTALSRYFTRCQGVFTDGELKAGSNGYIFQVEFKENITFSQS